MSSESLCPCLYSSSFIRHSAMLSINLVFHRQRGIECLLLSLAMALQHENVDFWRELILEAIKVDKQTLIQRYPDEETTSDWFTSQLASSKMDSRCLTCFVRSECSPKSPDARFCSESRERSQAPHCVSFSPIRTTISTVCGSF